MPSELETAIRRTRRQIDTLEGPVRREMADLYLRSVRTLNVDLELVTMRIREARDAGIDVSPDWLRRQDRYIRLMGQAEREFARFADDGIRLIDSARVRAVRGGAAEAWELLEASGIEQGFRANVPTRAVENALAATYDGPVARSLARYGTEGANTITDALLDGMVRGRGPRAIIRDIQRSLTGPVNAARLESLVRTEMLRGFRAGLAETYSQVSHLIEAYRRSAAKSARTCLACLAVDGKLYREPVPNFHIRCRCIYTPVPRGSTFQYQTGKEWFAEQSEATQRAMLPSREAYDAFAAGDITLDNFVGRKRSRVWGTSVVEKSGRQALEGVSRSAPPARKPPTRDDDLATFRIPGGL